MGPTASGKSALAEVLATKLSAQLVNADAFQVYRGLDIGTGKPLQKERYRLLDVCEASQQFGLGEWLGLALSVIQEAWEQKRSVIVVGGTGLYIRALTEQYASIAKQPDPALRAALIEEELAQGSGVLVRRLQELSPEIASATDLANPLRVRRALEKIATGEHPLQFQLPAFATLKIGLEVDPSQLKARIRERIDKMLSDGWLEEVRGLMSRGIGEDAPAMKAIGYRELLHVLEGKSTLQEATSGIERATGRYAKRQRTWLRSEPRLKCLQMDGTEAVADEVLSFLARTPTQEMP
jgi:tRNA dimethylallyltransferase